MKKIEILQLPPYYYPEQVSSSHLTDDLEEAFFEAGFHTTAYAPIPCRGIDKETREKYRNIKHERLLYNSIDLYRFFLFKEGKNPIGRAVRYIICNMIQYRKGIKAKGVDLVFSGSTPPTQGLLCSMVARKLTKRYGRKVPFVYSLQDVFPDSLVNAKMTKDGSLIWKIGRKIEDYTYRNSDVIIVISNDIKKNILKKGVDPNRITVIPNWISTEDVYPILRENNRLFDEYNISREKFIVLYAGTMGAMQGTEIIINAAEQVKDEDIHFVIFGAGSDYESTKRYVEEHNLKNVSINGMLPPERVSEVYSMGNVDLITCKPGVGKAGMPSKTWSIMACNVPIIASFDLESELAHVLSFSKAGMCVPPGSANDLVKAILHIKETGLNSKGREYVVSHADKNACTLRYIDTIKSVLRKEYK